jgi:hypothetical protein
MFSISVLHVFIVLTGGAFVELRISSHINNITNSYTGRTLQKPGTCSNLCVMAEAL